MTDVLPGGLKPLKMTCTSTDCENGLHCFRQKTRRAPLHGRCRSCGADLIDWPRVHERQLSDAQHTFAALRNERIRHHYFHVEIDQRAVNYARRKGFRGLAEAMRRRLRSSVGPAQPFRDGTQTPKDGNACCYAQHATASCCRKCIEEWHRIPRGRELTDAEVDYLAELGLLYIRERLPVLTENGEKVPPIRFSGRSPQSSDYRR